MSFSTSDFGEWMKKQGSTPSESILSSAQVKILKEYPECETANDLPFDIQKMIIELNDHITSGELQNEVDRFLMNQYSLLSRKFREYTKES